MAVYPGLFLLLAASHCFFSPKFHIANAISKWFPISLTEGKKGQEGACLWLQRKAMGKSPAGSALLPVSRKGLSFLFYVFSPSDKGHVKRSPSGGKSSRSRWECEPGRELSGCHSFCPLLGFRFQEQKQNPVPPQGQASSPEQQATVGFTCWGGVLSGVWEASGSSLRTCSFEKQAIPISSDQWHSQHLTASKALSQAIFPFTKMWRWRIQGNHYFHLISEKNKTRKE